MIDTARLSNGRLLALYAVLLQILLQGMHGFEGARALGLAQSDQIGFSVYCLTGQLPGEPKTGKTKPAAQPCAACHLHSVALAVEPAALALPVLYGVPWRTAGLRLALAPLPPRLGGLGCRGPPSSDV